MKRTVRLVVCGLLGFVALLACKPSVPHEFLSPDEMEDVLYDYHLADAMAQTAPGDYAGNLVAYRQAVLKKYGISQEKFDTSMVYYMRHTSELHGIYERLADRLENEAHDLGTSVSISETSFSANGDTTDVWRQERGMVLIPKEPFNVVSYSVKADTTFHKGDSFILTFYSDFIFQDGTRDGVATLALLLGNDSIASRTVHVSSAGITSLAVADEDSLGVKEVRGFFMLANGAGDGASSATTLKVMSLSRIHLLRCHPKPLPKPMEQSIPTNTAAPDSQRMRPEVERK